MKYRLYILLYERCRNALYQESRRYAGHSKWQNIKHIKQENDASKSTLFRSLVSQMRIAVTETGTTDLSMNVRLAQLIDRAKKANMPAATLKATLEKLQKPKEKVPTQIVTVRCPGKCVLVLFITTNNLTAAKLNVASKLKKHNAKLTDSSALNIFDCTTLITTSKACTFDQVMEDAIKIDVVDVQEVKDNDTTHFEFKCEFLSGDKATSQLQNLGYNIIAIDDVCIPLAVAELTETDLQNVNSLKEKLLSFEEVDKIEDNIA